MNGKRNRKYVLLLKKKLTFVYKIKSNSLKANSGGKNKHLLSVFFIFFSRERAFRETRAVFLERRGKTVRNCKHPQSTNIFRERLSYFYLDNILFTRPFIFTRNKHILYSYTFPAIRADSKRLFFENDEHVIPRDTTRVARFSFWILSVAKNVPF